MPDVLRAYVPRCQFRRSEFRQQTIAQIQALNGFPNALLQTPVDPVLPHRKIWVWLYSFSATYTWDADLVATLNGAEVFRMKIGQYGNSGNNRWLSAVQAASGTAGGANESLLTFVGASNALGVAPWRVNLACDTLQLNIVAITGAAALFDAGIYVLSQAGI